MNVQHGARAVQQPRGATKPPDPVCRDIANVSGASTASRTDAEKCRRAAMLARMAARELAGVRSVIERTDGAATLTMLRQVAGDCDGFADSREVAA